MALVPAADYTLSPRNYTKQALPSSPGLSSSSIPCAQILNCIRAYNHGMDDSKLVVVDAFASQIEADLAKSILESAGLDATIQADRAGGMRDHLAWSGTGFRVLVRKEDAAKAREILTRPGEARTQ